MIGNGRRAINLEATKEKRQRFTGAIRRRVKLCFLFLAARDTNDRCENDIGIRGHSGWYLPCAIA
jgi:hypothetical protein